MNWAFSSEISFCIRTALWLALLASSSYLIWTLCLTPLTEMPPCWLIQLSHMSYPCLVRLPSLDWAPVIDSGVPRMMSAPVVVPPPLLVPPQARATVPNRLRIAVNVFFPPMLAI